MSILCDFGGGSESEVLLYIVKRLKELTDDDTHKFGKFMLMLETLSSNRNLQKKLKKAEDMLKKIELEKLPSYEIGFEYGIEKATLKNAIVMIKRFKLSIDEVAKELNIDKEKLLEFIKNQG